MSQNSPTIFNRHLIITEIVCPFFEPIDLDHHASSVRVCLYEAGSTHEVCYFNCKNRIARRGLLAVKYLHFSSFLLLYSTSSRFSFFPLLGRDR